ncbi:hypothetical protein NIES2101_38130 [Calothrix sp. HK-06]|nr:hypothetical protein NIES2101_38130 [Calothrix sp. HK-06]
MTATRIVLPSKHKPFAEELLAVTGIDSLSNLFVVFLTRYGHHLKVSWNITNFLPGQHFPTPTATYQVPEVSVIPSQINYQKQDLVQLIQQTTEPNVELIKPDPEPNIQLIEPDPVIARLAGLIDIF